MGPALSLQPKLFSPEPRPACVRHTIQPASKPIPADIFRVVPPSFLPGYKNPCWAAPSGGGVAAVRCLPYFHIIGVSKCGTTDLYRRLALHPHVAPSRNKGPHFWDEKHSADWYVDLYSDAAVAAAAAPTEVRQPRLL